MTTWHQHITAKIAPLTQLSLVYDPHGLVQTPAVQTILATAGYELYFYTDSLTFRLDYEGMIRPKLRATRSCYLLVVVPQPIAAGHRLPYVLIHQHDAVEVNFGDIFPMLHSSPLTECTADDVDVLWPAAQRLQRPLDILQTQQFVLRERYAIDLSQVTTREDALVTLCALHMSQLQLPPMLIGVVSHSSMFRQTFGEQAGQLLGSAPRFLQYLQGVWHQAAAPFLGIDSAGDAHPAFDVSHPRLMVYIIAFFHQQLLTPMPIGVPVVATWPDWLRVGVTHDAAQAAQVTIATLHKTLLETIPSASDLYTVWVAYAQRYAVYINKRAAFADDTPDDLQHAVDARFRAWLIDNYKKLHSYPPIKPVMVHHVTLQMQRVRQQHPTRKQALIVVDGMAMYQWEVIQAELVRQLPASTITSTGVFAWIPTLTNVSRQAIFAGATPRNFADTITGTNAEEALWKKRWDGEFTKEQVGYLRALGSGSPQADLAPFLENPNMQVLGFVVDSIDTFVHNTTLGMQGLQSDVAMWSARGYLRTMLQLLLDAHYDIWLTADHGNTVATGFGTLTEGVLVNQRGARARVYNNETLRTRALARFPDDTFAWPSIELPSDFLPLLPNSLGAYATAKTTIISHGGASLSEVIVPFVRISSGGPS